MFTTNQRNVLIGSILGDGGLYLTSSKPHFYLKQKEASKDYVFWIYNFFNSFCKSSPIKRKDNNQWYFRTRSLDILFPFYEKFYKKNGRKKIPSNIGDLFVSPLSLAVWYMEDGTLDFRKKSHCSFSIMTNCFTAKETNLLSRTLWENFKIHSTVQNPHCRGKSYPRIYIGSMGRENFIKTVFPFIHKCFMYKMPQNRVSPSETDSNPPWIGRDRRYRKLRK
jgi:hypothetical protein